jgi:hypothetical protein
VDAHPLVALVVLVVLVVLVARGDGVHCFPQ